MPPGFINSECLAYLEMVAYRRYRRDLRDERIRRGMRVARRVAMRNARRRMFWGGYGYRGRAFRRGSSPFLIIGCLAFFFIPIAVLTLVLGIFKPIVFFISIIVFLGVLAAIIGITIAVRSKQDRVERAERQARLKERLAANREGRVESGSPAAAWRRFREDITENGDEFEGDTTRQELRQEIPFTGTSRGMGDIHMEGTTGLDVNTGDETDIKFCEYCGSEITPGTKFCSTCGAAIPGS
ncbi:hypothetical protein GF325_17645 [Candidatus Bathyarchaeota archaeon]|nr:hypothetical protein [Candidatus Bathyarchaeota archaeon]